MKHCLNENMDGHMYPCGMAPQRNIASTHLFAMALNVLNIKIKISNKS